MFCFLKLLSGLRWVRGWVWALLWVRIGDHILIFLFRGSIAIKSHLVGWGVLVYQWIVSTSFSFPFLPFPRSGFLCVCSFALSPFANLFGLFEWPNPRRLFQLRLINCACVCPACSSFSAGDCCLSSHMLFA